MPITDAFTGTDGTAIETYSANWALVRSSLADDFEINTNGLILGGTAEKDLMAKRTESGIPDAHYAQVVISAIALNKYMGPAVRCQAADSNEGYGFEGDTTQCLLFEVNTTTWTQLGSAGTAFSATQVIKLDANGTTLTPTKNGVTTGTPGAQTDATYATGAPGVCGWCDVSGVGTRLDDFECTSAPGGILRQMMAHHGG